ncbi:MAG: hypothetical protein HY721_12215 [Planctomycetes bacterium]|nr:hypothetical protein [Planctomycetota bacterium]
MASSNTNGRTRAARDRRLTRAEVVKLIDRGARKRRAMSAEELVSRYRAGTLYDPGEVADLLGLASLLAEDDPLFVAP